MDKSEKMISDNHLQAVLDIWSQKREQTTFSISGNCMSPMIKDGDYLIVEHGSQDIHIGDVVAFGIQRNPSIHRVIKIVDDGKRELFLLKPDRYNTPHPFILKEQILGKVIEIRGSNGRFDLNSLFGKYMNYILWIRSYISWRSSNANSRLWRGIHLTNVIRSKVFFGRYPIDMILWKGLLQAHRIWLLVLASLLTHKRRSG